VLADALGDILELADEDVLPVSELGANSHLCVCGASGAADGPWLRSLFLNPPTADEFEEADRARRQTAQLLGRVVRDGVLEAPQDAFRRALAFGDFAESDPLAREMPIARAWRGAILRNFSVGAWRRLWSWLVDLLSEPAPVSELAEALAAELPDVTVTEMLAALPDRVQKGVLLPAEDALRSAQWAPHPLTEVQLLMLGALRLDDLHDRALGAFAGSEREDDLGPRWVRAQLDARQHERLPDFGRWLAEMMVARAQRVALTKMDRRGGRFWIPSRIRERGGLISRLAPEGWFDVGLRIDTCSVAAERLSELWMVSGG